MAYSNERAEKAVELFTEMMISRMKEMKASDWKRGWMAGDKSLFGLPQNSSGRNYSGMNSLFLQWNSARHGYRMPVFLTFLQAQKESLRIKEGSKSFPVLYWAISIKDKNGNKILEDEYRQLSEKEKKEYDVKSFLRAFTVFNVDQTNMMRVNPELYKKLLKRFQPSINVDVSGMYENKAIDRMIDTQGWICPIKPSETAKEPYYSLTGDMVVLPMKHRFKVSTTRDEIYKDGMEYYSSALHEFAHSTGASSRLNRIDGISSSEDIAREELVAELSAALVGNTMGFDKRILDNNAAYVDGWLSALSDNPRFIVSVMSDVSKASHMIIESIDKQKIALGERPLLYADQQVAKSESKALLQNQSEQHLGPNKEGVMASVYKTPEGEFAVQATVNGKSLEPQKIDRKTGTLFMTLPLGKERNAALANIVHTAYGNKLLAETKTEENHSRSMKL